MQDRGFAHRMGVLAYRQRGRIDLPAEDTFCSPGVFARIQARKMKKKYLILL